MTVFVEAMHTIKPLTNTAFDTFVEVYRESVIPAFARHGYDLLGAFKRTGGEMGQDVLLFRFENLAAMEQASASMAKDTAMYQAIAAMMEGGIQISESAKTAYPVPYATEQRLESAPSAKPESPRQYMQAVLQLTLGGQEKAYEVLGKLVDWGSNAGAVELVTAYETALGQRGELTDIWILPHGVPNFDYVAGDPIAEFTGPLREVAPEKSIYYLNPLPYSPLQ
ncbi:MAG TPA: NIPSNAP family protein [Dehalococcoidia bacterium]|nr:NIPSNAP family protein [Dehalococcoidia bacterium]